MKEFLPVLKNRYFMYLWTSQVLSQLAINIMNFLVLVHLFESTGSTIASSFIWVAYGIPAVIFGPIAAAMVDLYDRRKILILSNLVQAIVIGVYALLFQKFLYLSYGVVLAYSVMDQFYVPSETASLSSLVPKERLPQANGLFFISQQAATILGFGMAGVILEFLGFRFTMILGTIMLLVATFAVSRLPRIQVEKVKAAKTVEEKLIRFFSRIYEGYSFIRHRKRILYPFLFLMWLQVSLAILVVNLPVIGTEVLKTKASLAGVLTIGPGGIGALFGTFLVAKFISRKVRKKVIIDNSLLALAITFIVVSIVAPFLPFWPSRLVLIFSFFVVGVCYVSALIPTITYLQVNTPRKLTGRVFGNFWFLTTVATMLPVLFSATITEVLGVNLLMVGLGLFAGVVYVVSKIYLTKTFNNPEQGEEVYELKI